MHRCVGCEYCKVEQNGNGEFRITDCDLIKNEMKGCISQPQLKYEIIIMRYDYDNCEVARKTTKNMANNLSDINEKLAAINIYNYIDDMMKNHKDEIPSFPLNRCPLYTPLKYSQKRAELYSDYVSSNNEISKMMNTGIINFGQVTSNLGTSMSDFNKEIERLMNKHATVSANEI